MLDGSLLVISGDPFTRQPANTTNPLLEILPNEEPPFLTGFTFEDTLSVQADPNPSKLIPHIMDDYLNPQVATMMLHMDYFSGLGLSHNQQRITEFPHIPMQRHTLV